MTGNVDTLLFASNNRPGNIQEGRGGRFDLWMTTRSDPSNPTGWEPPAHLDAPINSGSNESSPHLSRDGLMLFFASDRPGLHDSGPVPGQPGSEQTFNNIWVAKRNSTSEPFGPPVSLAVHFLHLHTMLDPYLSADGSTLFFATPGLLNTTTGFADIWQVPVLRVPPPLLSISRIKMPSEP